MVLPPFFVHLYSNVLSSDLLVNEFSSIRLGRGRGESPVPLVRRTDSVAIVARRRELAAAPGEYAKALRLFERMQKCGVDFDETTLVVTLSACSEMGALDYGRWLHFLVDNSSLSRTLQVSNLLIDVYAKCGEVEEAHRVLNRMNAKNLVT
nr:pentatricopeptide repeat-containing protein At4g21065 [Ipomoea trifida]